MEENNKHTWKDLPLFLKAKEINALAHRLMELIEEDLQAGKEDETKEIALFMVKEIVSNAFLIPGKIAGAESVEWYNLKMENATIIKIAAEKVLTNSAGLMQLTESYEDYIHTLRGEIEEFRVLFAEWVKAFDPTVYSIDRWGVFNPPGVNYDDYDPDDFERDPDDFDDIDPDEF